MMDQRRRMMKEKSGPDHQHRIYQQHTVVMEEAQVRMVDRHTVVPLRFSEVMEEAQVRMAGRQQS
jgi:hypothetical protein